MGRNKNKRILLSDVAISGTWKANSSASARNLRKGDLGGVIFGCKNYTMKECLTQNLFGLPGPHISYVKNIVPGMPLFLFNYSDRKLHGIYEAESYGRENINPHGWTANGNEETEYPAQVRIKIRKQCQALMENQFQPIISNNYYTDKHFWFELDSEQTSELISLFEASSFSVRFAAIPKNVCTIGSTSSFEASSGPQKKGFSWCDNVKNLSNPDKRNGTDDSESTWNPHGANEDDDFWSTKSEAYMGHWDESEMEAHPDREAVGKEVKTLVSPHTGEVLTNSSDLLLTTDQEMKVAIVGPMICVMPSEEEWSQEEPLDSEETRMILVNSSNHMSDSYQSVRAGPSITSEIPSVQKYFQEEPLVSAEKTEISVCPSDFQSALAQLMEEVQKLQTSSLEQLKKMSALENNQSESQVQIQQLNTRIKELESISDPTIKRINERSGWDPWYD